MRSAFDVVVRVKKEQRIKGNRSRELEKVARRWMPRLSKVQMYKLRESGMEEEVVVKILQTIYVGKH